MLKAPNPHLVVTKTEKVNLSIVTVQLESVYKDPQQSYSSKVKLYLQKYKGKLIDLIILPELALTGYDMESRSDIFPLCEVQSQGLHYKIAAEIAKEYKSYVALGYPEKCENSDALYNSCYVLDRTGELVYHYRKILLFEVDKRFFSEGKKMGFFMLKNLQGKSIKTSVAICMDINYKDFVNFDEYPLSEYLEKEDIELLIFPTAWTTPNFDISKISKKEEEKTLKDTTQYWSIRLLSWIKSAAR